MKAGSFLLLTCRSCAFGVASKATPDLNLARYSSNGALKLLSLAHSSSTSRLARIWTPLVHWKNLPTGPRSMSALKSDALEKKKR